MTKPNLCGFNLSLQKVDDRYALWSADKKRVLNAIQTRFEQDEVIQGSALRG